MLKKRNIHLSPQEYLKDLGRKLYIKITEVIQAEINEIEEEDCIKYIYNLVVNRTYDGYQTEVKTIYEQLQQELNIPIKPASNKWDRLYNVDFYIEINGKYIGLQIKPISYENTPEIHNWKQWLSKTHRKFEEEQGGKVFIVFSVKKDNKKKIYNTEIIEEIKKEIDRLKKSS
ncbi:MAG: MjaI family restriction endonuclease [Thermodesulfobacteriaceae bacterium]|nr:MjaI family restriction endonuclease [Thermodesulfobacteriaceae bacterium]